MEFLPEAIDDALFGPDKIYLATRSYVRFLQILFSKWETYKWSEDENVSKIVIVRDLPEVLTVESKMPLIVVHNNGGMWRGPGPSQEFRGHIFRPNLFPKTFVDTVLTSVTIYCFARTDAESSKLAWTIFKAIPIASRIDSFHQNEANLKVRKKSGATPHSKRLLKHRCSSGLSAKTPHDLGFTRTAQETSIEPPGPTLSKHGSASGTSLSNAKACRRRSVPWPS